MKLTTGCIATLSIALLVGACGGANVDESAFADPGDGGTSGSDATPPDKDGGQPGTDGGNPKKDGDTPVVDTAPPGPGPVTAENVCQRLADAICTPSLSSCCSKRGYEYKEAGCRAAIAASCAESQNAVKDGRTTLNVDAFGACSSAWSSLATKCGVSVLDFIKSYAPCNQLFNGTTAPGGTCSEDYHCKVSSGAFANCTDGSRCESLVVVSGGAPCGLVGGNRAYCDVGFYCAYTSSSSGTCREVKLGNPCSENWQCGYGNYCQRSFTGSGNCAAALGAGASCSFGGQCISGACSGGRCTDPNISIASAGVCSGAG